MTNSQKDFSKNGTPFFGNGLFRNPLLQEPPSSGTNSSGTFLFRNLLFRNGLFGNLPLQERTPRELPDGRPAALRSTSFPRKRAPRAVPSRGRRLRCARLGYVTPSEFPLTAEPLTAFNAWGQCFFRVGEPEVVILLTTHITTAPETEYEVLPIP